MSFLSFEQVCPHFLGKNSKKMLREENPSTRRKTLEAQEKSTTKTLSYETQSPDLVDRLRHLCSPKAEIQCKSTDDHNI